MKPLSEIRDSEQRNDLVLGNIGTSDVVKVMEALGLPSGDWWNQNVKHRFTEFKEWVGDYKCPSKVAVRKHVAFFKYKSIVDVGCGLCSEYHGYAADGYGIKYVGVDSCEPLVQRAKGHADVRLGCIQELPLDDHEVEVAFARHVLEHVFGYEKGLAEMIRVASQEVIVVFFIPPHDLKPPASDKFKFSVEEGLWHNEYQKARMEDFIMRQPMALSLDWEQLPDTNESILHVKIKPKLKPMEEADESPEDRKVRLRRWVGRPAEDGTE